jgi:hypothetical protein
VRAVGGSKGSQEKPAGVGVYSLNGEYAAPMELGPFFPEDFYTHRAPLELNLQPFAQMLPRRGQGLEKL